MLCIKYFNAVGNKALSDEDVYKRRRKLLVNGNHRMAAAVGYCML